jgi:hypothetical protein
MFDGTNEPQYVTIQDSQVLHLSMAMTIEVWIRTLSSATSIIVGKPYGGGEWESFSIFFSNGWINTSSSPAGVGVAWSLGAGSWHHLAATYEVATQTTMQLYIDGMLAQVGKSQTVASYDWHPLFIGATMINGAISAGFRGAIDEVRIYSTVRTAQQIAADIKGYCSTATDPDLVVYLPFDEGSGTVTQDASVNHFEGTLGNPVVGTGASPTWVKSSVPF